MRTASLDCTRREFEVRYRNTKCAATAARTVCWLANMSRPVDFLVAVRAVQGTNG